MGKHTIGTHKITRNIVQTRSVRDYLDHDLAGHKFNAIVP